jgi:hypothetical protein
LYTRRTGSCQYLQHQLDVSNDTCFSTACFTNLLVLGSWSSQQSPSVSVTSNFCFFMFLSSPRWIGVLLRDQGSQLVRIITVICKVLSNSLTLFRYANCAWIPVLLVFVAVAGINGKNFVNVQTEPASVVQIFNFGATVAGFTITWSALSSDYTTYFHPDVPRFVEVHDGCYRYLILSTKIAGEFSYTHTLASQFL